MSRAPPARRRGHQAVTLLFLLVNLATVHVSAVAGVIGPVHGAAYLTAIVATLLTPDARAGARWWAVLPGVGGLFAVRRLGREAA